MSTICVQGHSHASEAQRLDCDARYFDSMSLIKMAQVNFQGPQKIARIHEPGRAAKLGPLDVTVFSEEEIVPWKLEDDQVDTDPGLYVPGLGEDEEAAEESDEDPAKQDEEVPTREDAAGTGPNEEITDPRGLPPRKPG